MDNKLTEALLSDSDSNNDSIISENLNSSKKKKKTKVKLVVEFNSGYMKSKSHHLKNKNISKYVNVYNKKNEEYYSPERFRASYDGFRYLPNSNIYQDIN